MSVDLVAVISLCWGAFINTLTFLASRTSLGAYISHLASRFGRKLRSWGFKWPETPVPPDRQELRDALMDIRDLLYLLKQISADQKVMSGLLREMMDQGTNHHSEIRGRLSTISSDAHAIYEVVDKQTLQSDVHVAVTFEVDRLLRNLPQLIRGAETEAEPTPRHRRVASA
ncbi:hypothetical protein F5Y06DRAFT_303695 [Hypoxylon sp. FL0890]|nr:hypothetical protein F5Y06DRAFT_303695 [Hypoxylon sp. FL0890]